MKAVKGMHVHVNVDWKMHQPDFRPPNMVVRDGDTLTVDKVCEIGGYEAAEVSCRKAGRFYVSTLLLADLHAHNNPRVPGQRTELEA